MTHKAKEEQATTRPVPTAEMEVLAGAHFIPQSTYIRELSQAIAKELRDDSQSVAFAMALTDIFVRHQARVLPRERRESVEQREIAPLALEISKRIGMPARIDTIQAAIASFLESHELSPPLYEIKPIQAKRQEPVKLPDASVPKDVAPAFETEVLSFEPTRERLSDERASITHKFNVGGHEGYITVGLYPDGRPGEVFITMAKEGSTIAGLMDSLGTVLSINLQYGVPLEALVNKFSHAKFDPMGDTETPDIPVASSIVDYIARWLELRFLSKNGKQSENKDETDNATA